MASQDIALWVPAGSNSTGEPCLDPELAGAETIVHVSDELFAKCDDGRAGVDRFRDEPCRGNTEAQ
jgi:hypothetical protein